MITKWPQNDRRQRGATYLKFITMILDLLKISKCYPNTNQIRLNINKCHCTKQNLEDDSYVELSKCKSRLKKHY